MRCSSCGSDNRKRRKFRAACSGDSRFICSATIDILLDEVWPLIDQTGAERWWPHVHVERGEMYRLMRDDGASRRELIDAHRLFAEMGATGHAERLTRELGP